MISRVYFVLKIFLDFYFISNSLRFPIKLKVFCFQFNSCSTRLLSILAKSMQTCCVNKKKAENVLFLVSHQERSVQCVFLFSIAQWVEIKLGKHPFLYLRPCLFMTEHLNRDKNTWIRQIGSVFQKLLIQLVKIRFQRTLVSFIKEILLEI